MGVQQLLLSVGGSGGGGGSGLPPNTYAGLTFWLDTDDTTRLFQNATATTPATADGDPIVRANSKSPTTRCFSGSGGILDVGGASGSNCIHLPPSAGSYQYFNHSPAGVMPTTFATLSNLVAAANHTIIYALRVNDSNADGGFAYLNDPLLYDPNGYLFVSTYRSGGDAFLDTYIEVGAGVKVVSPAMPIGSWRVVTFQHAGGQSKVRVNGGAWFTATAGNIPNLTGTPIDFSRAPAVRDVDIAQHCIYNAARTDAEILEVERYFGNKVGQSF